jgi:hypothetical protein
MHVTWQEEEEEEQEEYKGRVAGQGIASCPYPGGCLRRTSLAERFRPQRMQLRSHRRRLPSCIGRHVCLVEGAPGGTARVGRIGGVSLWLVNDYVSERTASCQYDLSCSRHPRNS